MHRMLGGGRRFLAVLFVLALLPACTPGRPVVGTNEVGTNETGTTQAGPPSGATLATGFFEKLTAGRKATPALDLVRRDPTLDGRASAGLRIIEAGPPDDVDIIKHLRRSAALPEGLEYAVGFEEATPGLDDRTRRLGQRAGGSNISDALLAGDPGLEAVGWAAAGPWAVIVLQYRPLAPADGPRLQATIEADLQRRRPHLRLDSALRAVASGALEDGLLDDDDEVRLARAGGVPVVIVHHQRGPHRATSSLNWALTHDGPGTLQEPWLDRIATAVAVTDRGNVQYVVVATGEPDRRSLAAQLQAAEVQAPALVNEARATARLPAVRLDPALAVAAKRALAEAIRLGCVEGPGCAAADPPDVDTWYVDRRVWHSGEDAFTWDLRPADDQDSALKRFGAAAALAPDGLVWTLLLLDV